MVFDVDPSDTPLATDSVVDGANLRVVDLEDPAKIVNELTTVEAGSKATVSAPAVPRF